MRKVVAGTFAFFVAAFGTAAAQETSYPTKTVTIVVPAAAGGATDVVARIVAERLQQNWGKAVVVENVAGGAMNIGATQVAKAAPDGHTLFVSPPAPVTFNKKLYKQLNYEPEAFTPITVLAKTPNTLLVRPSLDAKTVRELIAYLKSNNGKATFGSSGVGTTLHLTAVRFAKQEGLNLVHVPYRGEVAVLTDLMAGHIDMFFGTLSTALPLHQSGKLKMLAVAQPERSADAPNVPTMIEAGVPDFVSFAWYALAAPPKLPKSIQEKINREVVAILNEPKIKEKLKGLRLEPGGGNIDETLKFFASEKKLWSEAIDAAKIEPQ